MVDETVNATMEWRARLAGSVARMQRGERDFRWFNVGDSIATGALGIESTEQHYVAVAAGELAQRYAVPSGRHVHTAGDDFSDGTVLSSAATAPGGFFGSRGWRLAAGEGLRYVPGGLATRFAVDASGALRYSTDEGETWMDAAAGLIRIDVPGGANSLLLTTALPEVHVGHVGHELRARALTWYTSGIGASRIADLHAGLAADGGRGYAAYGAADPDLLTIEIGVNNTIHADEVTLRRSKADLRAVLESFLNAGVRTIALVGANPVREDFQPGPWTVADAYAQLYHPLAAEFDLPLLDVARRWNDYGTAHARGLLADQVHPTALGHVDLARMASGLFGA